MCLDEEGKVWHNSSLFENELILVDHKLKIGKKNVMDAIKNYLEPTLIKASKWHPIMG